MKVFDKITDFVIKTRTLYWVIFYLIVKLILILFIIKPYNYNFWALVGIWEGFVKLNPDFIETGSVIFQEGGYDGQFFYFLTKYFMSNDLPFPILDFFKLRFHRLGMSLTLIPLIKLLGFSYYPIALMSLLTFLHILGFFALRALCETNQKYFSIFFLFSPFSLNSDLLLVSDSMVVSFSLIGMFFLIKSGFFIVPLSKNFKYFIISILLFTISILIKESAVFLLFPLFLYFLINKNFFQSILILFPLIVYLVLIFYIEYFLKFHQGTNPLNFFQLSDFPFFGLWKSIDNPNNIRGIIRELVKLPLIFYFICLLMWFRKIRSLNDFILLLPIFIILIQVTIAEEGYWRTFDNISRMFTFSLPYSILLYSWIKKGWVPGIVFTSFLLFILLMIRIIIIKTPMNYRIYM